MEAINDDIAAGFTRIIKLKTMYAQNFRDCYFLFPNRSNLSSSSDHWSFKQIKLRMEYTFYYSMLFIENHTSYIVFYYSTSLPINNLTLWMKLIRSVQKKDYSNFSEEIQIRYLMQSNHAL